MAALTLAETAEMLAERGYRAINLHPGQKAAVERAWTTLNYRPVEIRELWETNPEYNVGVLTGVQVADGVFLVAIDIDVEDQLVIERVKEALNVSGSVLSAKKGKKGLTIFAQSSAPLNKLLIKKNKSRAVADIEVLGRGQQTVVPPSIHPLSHQPYTWVGVPLHEVEPLTLPIYDDAVARELEFIVKHPDSKMFLLNELRAATDGEPGNLHESGLEAVASMIKCGFHDDRIRTRVTRAFERALGAAFDPAKEGRKIEEWIKSARSKKFDEKKDVEKPDVLWARWLRDTWDGGAKLSVRMGQFFRYRDGAHDQISEADMLRILATCGDPAIEGLGARGWKLVAETALTVLPHAPVVNPHRRVCLVNGTFDFDEMELRDHDREDYLLSRLDFKYDPEARCPLYEDFLSQVFMHEDDDEVVRLAECYEEFVAMTMFECLHYHKFLVLQGPTRSGKSVLTSIARMMHSSNSVSAVMAHDFGNERSRTGMVGKLVNITNETSTVNAISDEYLKSIVAGDPIEARMLYQEPQYVVLPTRLIIATNELLRSKDTSGAVEKRMLIVPCNNQVPDDEQDPFLVDKLREERSGIFNRMLLAWKRLDARGMFIQPRSARDLLDEMARSSNPVIQWLLERTHQGRRYEDDQYQLPRGVAGYTASDVLYDDYKMWAQSKGFQSMSITTWGGRLTSLKMRGIKPASYNKRLPDKRVIKVRNLSLTTVAKY